MERVNRLAPWLLPPAIVAGLALALWLLRGSPPESLRYAAGALFVVPVLWVVVSALWPARADRTCPRCGRDSLRRLSRANTQGLVCTRCDWRDPAASSWFLAEEEGPLEDLVLEQRERKRTLRRRVRRSPVDSGRVAD